MRVLGALLLCACGGASLWPRLEDYYYTNLTLQLQTLDADGRCLPHMRLADPPLRAPSDPGLLLVFRPEVDQQLRLWWLNMPAPRQHRVHPDLCAAAYLKKKRAIFDHAGCFIPVYMSPAAPRCQNAYLKRLCEGASQGPDDSSPRAFFIPEAHHLSAPLPPDPWLIAARDAFVTACGQVSASCGSLHTTANCMARTFKPAYSHALRACTNLTLATLAQLPEHSTVSCARTATFAQSASNLIPPVGALLVLRRVFVVAQVDDTYVYHIHLEVPPSPPSLLPRLTSRQAVPRILAHAAFLRANPDVLLLWGCDTKGGARATARGLALGMAALSPYLRLMRLDPGRVVAHTHVFAREVFLPMEGGCQDPVYNTWQILQMRAYFLALVDKDKQAASESAPRPVLLLVRRSSGSKATRNFADNVRQWSDAFAAELLGALALALPSHETRIFDDRDEALMDCLLCQIRAFSLADGALALLTRLASPALT